MSIRRDEYGIICQHNPDDPEYMDGGDSAHKTGIMAFSGSQTDIEILILFTKYDERGMLMMRHPFQYPWNNPYNSSRDQLLPFVAGLWESNARLVTSALKNRCQNNGWRCQNVDFDAPGTTKPFPNGPDWLAPDARLHLKLCAGERGRWWGYAWLNAAILWSTKVKPWEESNNIIVQCVVAGPKYIRRYCNLHPDWKKNVLEYWGNRNQIEIGQLLIARVEREL